MPAQATLIDRLATVKDERAALTEKSATLKAQNDAAQAAYAGGGYDLGSTEFQAAKDARAAYGQVEDRVQDLVDQELDLVGKMAASSQKRDRVAAARESGDALDQWDTSQLFAASDTREAFVRASSSKSKFEYRLGEVASRDAMVADVTGSANMRRSTYGGVIPQLRRNLNFLDLIPTGTMDGNTFPYTVESGSLAGALETAEGTRKPEGATTLTDASADAQTIAVWQKIRKQALADFSAIESIVSSRLRYQVLLRLENEIIAGDGTGSNLTGLLTVSGTNVVAYPGSGTTTATPGEQILTGITNVQLAYGNPSAVVVHPNDWAKLIKAKADVATAGDGHYYSGGPFEITPHTIWGVPVVASVGVTAGTAIVADFNQALLLLIRQGVELLISDNDGTDFTQNLVTLLAEMRAALPIFRPSLISKVALA